jgi:hypothetical protein
MTAEALKKEIISYKLPKGMENQGLSFHRTITLLFPKNGDEAISDEIRSLTSQSRWLVIVCSEQTRAAPVMSRLILFFSELGRKSNILPLLVEGEPSRSFPEPLFEKRTSHWLDEDSVKRSVTETVEPLAVDIRAKNPKASLRLLRQLKVKVVAAMIDVPYDALERRHYKRTRRRLMTAAAILVSVPILAGSFFTYMWWNTKRQMDIAVEKAQISKDLFTKICSEYPERLSHIPSALPVIDEILLDSLEQLKVADSVIFEKLDLDRLLLPDSKDDARSLLVKGMLLRYTGRSEEAESLYEKACQAASYGQTYLDSSLLFLRHTSPEIWPSGLCILSIHENQAQYYGLSAGDIIVSIDNYKFRSMEQFYLYRNSLSSSDTIEITVLHPCEDKLEENKVRIRVEDLNFSMAEM